VSKLYTAMLEHGLCKICDEIVKFKVKALK